MTDCFRKLLQVLENPSRHLQPKPYWTATVKHLMCYLQMLKLLATSISSTSRSTTSFFRLPCDFQRPKQSNNNNRTIAQSTVFRELQVFEGPSRHQQPKPYRTARRAPIALPQRLKLTTTTIPCTAVTPAVFVEPPTASRQHHLAHQHCNFYKPRMIRNNILAFQRPQSRLSDTASA